ncbi:MAG: hypothetical protein OK454_05060 [Thaumarchaeota archaeon]|nr:hypothetical protein [Nitrososphaerota archaeon]
MVEGYSGRKSRRATGAATWVVVLVVAALAGAASVFVIESGSGTLQTSSTHTVSSFTTSTSGMSPAGGLTLSLTVNATDVSSGRGVAATVDEANTGSAPINVSASAKWPIQGLAIGPCGFLNYPIGLAVLRGNYDVANVSSAKALQIYRPGISACPMILASIGSFEFQASSDNATVFGGCQPAADGCMSEIINSTVSFNGYWNGSALTSFPSGVYTVVAGDEWGGMAILHFTVTGNAA